MKLLTTGAGYLLNDNRCSGGSKEEDDVLGCHHCQAVILKSKWLERAERCRHCDGTLCPGCYQTAQQLGCVPFNAWLERKINEAHVKEQNAKLLGI